MSAQTYPDILMTTATEPEFFSQIRMKRETFEAVLEILSPHCTKVFRGGHEPISCRDALLMSLRYLGSTVTMQEIATQYGFRGGAVHNCLSQIIDGLANFAEDYIKWPSSEDLPALEKEFRAIANFPGVLGVLGGCLVDFKPLKSLSDAYATSSKQYSMHLLAICDAQKKFMYVDVGFPGTAHDSEAFESTSFYSALHEYPCPYFPSPNFHIIGDNVYQMDKHVMVPFDDGGTLIPQNGRFSAKLRRTRVRIEQSLALLKARFQRLRYMYAKFDRLKKMVMACCILHNIVMNDSEEESLLWMEGSVGDVHFPDIPGITSDINISVDLSEFELPSDIGAVEKRDFVASLM